MLSRGEPTRWHLRPWIDALGYHWSWVPPLAILLCFGDRFPVDYRFMMIAAWALNFSHQAISLAIVYFDRKVFATERRRFTVLPLVLLFMFVTTAMLWHTHRSWTVPIYTIAYAWNFWHVYMQKYGILRLYAAKSGVAIEERTPGWVDRFLVFGSLPLIVATAGLRYVDTVSSYFNDVRAVTGAIGAALIGHAAVLVVIGALIAAASVGCFFYYERKHWSRPRLSAGGALIVMSAAFLILDPIKVAISFGISHTIEYFVFVWGWQKRTQAYRRPAITVFGLAVGMALFWYLGNAWGRDFGGGKMPTLAGLSSSEWLAVVSPYLAMTHFYFDGFLWKMRKPSVRANI